MILSGNPVDYLKAFAGGVGVSFTPCVFPLIPVIIGYIGINAGTSRLKGLSLTIAYVTGIAVTYSVLGLFASLTGRIFGMVSSHPVTYMAAGLIIIFFALLMFDVFKFMLPRFVTLPQLKRKDLISVFGLGLASGLVIGPCTAPALGAILLYLATKKNLVYGVTLLLCFAYGMGLTLILAGTFSSFLVSFPKAGKWMVYIKRLGAVILVVMGVILFYNGLRRL